MIGCLLLASYCAFSLKAVFLVSFHITFTLLVFIISHLYLSDQFLQERSSPNLCTETQSTGELG